jgi:hypothetical protein
LDGSRAWSVFNDARDLKFYCAGSSALVVSTAVDAGAHPGSDGLKLGKQGGRWRGWFSGLQSSIVTKSTDYSPTANDHTMLCDASSGPLTITLPNATAADQGRIYIVKKIDASPNGVTVAPNGTQSIDGDRSQVLAEPFELIEVQSNGSNWFIIGR